MKYFSTAKVSTLLFANLFLLITTGYAENPTQAVMVPVSTMIPDIQKTIVAVKAKTAVPVLFPTSFPPNTKLTTYFASSDLSQVSNGISYTINIDSTKDCHGVHYCNIGYISAKKDANPQVYYDMANRKITEPIILAHKIKGYYTPGHAMGDFFPANIQWQENGVLYAISWNTTAAIIRNMANSAINKGPH